MRDKVAISAYILKIVEKDQFLRIQMRAKEDFNRQLFSTDKYHNYPHHGQNMKIVTFTSH